MSDARERGPESLRTAAAQFEEAARAQKCWRCGCLHGSLRTIEASLSPGERSLELSKSIAAASSRLTGIQYDCLGCETCYPALALSALNVGADSCPQEPIVEREGWPPLPGSYTVLRFAAPVAICTLVDATLEADVARAAGPGVAIVGTCQTENLGIERLVQNVAGNPHIRFLILCGADSRQAVGHLPGQALLSLSRHGVDERSRIVAATGKRPMLKNISRAMVDHFRSAVEVVDLIGCADTSRVLDTARALVARNPGPAEPFAQARAVRVLHGALPQRMVPDPAGYFVVYPDRAQGLLSLEHYANGGVLDLVVQGATAVEVYSSAIEQALVSRLDHACYLGRELTRAELALNTDAEYVQDAAPEARAMDCSCHGACGEKEA